MALRAHLLEFQQPLLGTAHPHRSRVANRFFQLNSIRELSFERGLHRKDPLDLAIDSQRGYRRLDPIDLPGFEPMMERALHRIEEVRTRLPQWGEAHAGRHAINFDILSDELLGRWPEFLDIGLVYAFLNIIGTLAVLKFLRYGALGDAGDEEEEGAT